MERGRGATPQYNEIELHVNMKHVIGLTHKNQMFINTSVILLMFYNESTLELR